MNKIISFDIGLAKCGYAIGYKDNEMIFPGTVFRYKNSDEAVKAIHTILAQNSVELILIGRSPNEKVRLFQEDIVNSLNHQINLLYISEDMTTVEARNLLSEFNISARDEDVEAAMILIKRYFENKNIV